MEKGTAHSDEPCLVLCACPPGKAADIAHSLVEQRLAACVQILPGIRSIYQWQGKLCDDTEELLLAKTLLSCWPQAEGLIHSLHPYQVPEILCIPVSAMHLPYQQWMNEALLTKEP